MQISVHTDNGLMHFERFARVVGFNRNQMKDTVHTVVGPNNSNVAVNSITQFIKSYK